MSWNIDPAAKLTVLLPFDFSAAAREAVATAKRFTASDQRLHLLHVIPHVEAASPAFLVGEIQTERLLERARAELGQVAESCGAGGAQLDLRMGEPAREILDYAQEIDADMIVIPSRGKTGVRRWMLGSVAERVVRRARCPVLVLPIDDDADPDDEQG